MTTYFDEFQEAQARTQRFGLPLPSFSFHAGRFITPENGEKFPQVVKNAVGELGLEEVVAQCLAIHYRLRQPLEAMFGTSIAYTIGYVHTPPSYMFKKTEEELLDLMKNGISGSRVNLHAWLTLPSMEIIDISLPTSFAVLNKLDRGHGEVIARHADELVSGMKYHPMLIGEEYLRRIGALIEF